MNVLRVTASQADAIRDAVALIHAIGDDEALGAVTANMTDPAFSACVLAEIAALAGPDGLTCLTNLLARVRVED